MRRIRMPIALLAAAALWLAPLPAAAARPAFLDLLTSETATITAGGSAWVAISWQGTGEVTDFQITARAIGRGGNQVDVEYPANTGSFSSLMNDSTLSQGEIDFTALKLSVPYSVSRDLRLRVEATFVDQGRTRSRSYVVRVPVVEHTGADLEQVTTELGPVQADSSQWVGVSFAGFAPSVSGFSLRVTDPAGARIIYPGEGSATSLHHDATLVAGETDVARFLVDTTGLEPGSYQLGLEVNYRKDDAAGSVTGSVVLQVGG